MSEMPGQSTDDESLKQIFDDAMKMFRKIEDGKDPTNSDVVQMSIKVAISQFEKATKLVSLGGLFSRNESLEELPTETLQYLLLPALLGTLSLKLCNIPRKEIVNVADIYFRDFLQRCKDYGVTDVDLPQSDDSNKKEPKTMNEKQKIACMVLSRDAKINRYKEMKDIKEQLEKLEYAISSANVDDATRREYFTMLLKSFVNQSLDEIMSIQQEIPILEYMEAHEGEPKPKVRPPPPLKPVIITKDLIQKAVYGAGYPSLPTLTIEEFYDQRVREGTFPGACKIPHSTIQNPEQDADEADQIRKENLLETDDPEELARLRNMDEFKDEHKRGSGNRYNRS